MDLALPALMGRAADGPSASEIAAEAATTRQQVTRLISTGRGGVLELGLCVVQTNGAPKVQMRPEYLVDRTMLVCGQVDRTSAP